MPTAKKAIAAAAIEPPMRQRNKDGTYKRKFTVTEDVLERVYRMAQYGMTIAQMAGCFTIEESSFIKKFKKHPELKRVIDNGRNDAIEFVAGKLFEKIKAGSLPAIKFYLQTRAGFSEKQFIAIGADENSPRPIEMKIDTTDPQEAARLYQKFVTEK